MTTENGQARDPDLEVAEALDNLAEKLEARRQRAAASAERATRHRRTLDRVVPRLSKLAAEVHDGLGADPASSSQAARNGRVAAAADAIEELLREVPRPLDRIAIKNRLNLHPKTRDAALARLLRDQRASANDAGEYAVPAA